MSFRLKFSSQDFLPADHEVHVVTGASTCKSGFGMIDTIGKIVEKRIEWKQTFNYRSAPFVTSSCFFCSTAVFMLFSTRDFRASKYQIVGKKNPYESAL